MLKKGYLAGNNVYVCIDHTIEVVNDFMDKLDKPFNIIRKIMKGANPEEFLEETICHWVYKRIN